MFLECEGGKRKLLLTSKRPTSAEVCSFHRSDCTEHLQKMSTQHHEKVVVSGYVFANIVHEASKSDNDTVSINELSKER